MARIRGYQGAGLLGLPGPPEAPNHRGAPPLFFHYYNLPLARHARPVLLATYEVPIGYDPSPFILQRPPAVAPGPSQDDPTSLGGGGGEAADSD